MTTAARPLILLLALGLLLPTAGEARRKKEKTHNAAKISRELKRQVPGLQLEKEFRLRLGPVPLALIRPLLRFAESEAEEVRVVRKLRRIEVAAYEISGDSDLELPSDLHLGRRFEEDGWNTLVKVREDDGKVWVYMRPNDSGGIKEIMVVVLDDSELVVVNLRGRLDEMLAEAIGDDPEGFLGDLGAD